MSAPTRIGRMRDAGSVGELPVFLALAIACGIMLIAYFIYAMVHGIEPVTTAVALAFLCVCLLVFLYLCLNPDSLRSQYTEQTLSIASDMLGDIQGGLDREGADAICRRLLPETRAMTVAVTDRTCVLACAGKLAEDFPPGSPIHTPATHYAIDHALVQSFTSAVYVRAHDGSQSMVPAGIIAPLKVRERAIGTLKFYFDSPHEINRTQYALAVGFAELLSTQLAIHELEHQDQLTAAAELRALQAQINPHFLFNTLNTIAALTRTEPLRARELLREFSSFYRATLANSGNLIPVSRELAQTQRYLTFEKARFGEDRIIDTVDVQEGAGDALVPAFVIQPLVENAVRHGMRDEGPLHIAVGVKTVCERCRLVATEDGHIEPADDAAEDDTLIITVADDGQGMDKETARKLFNELLPDAPERDVQGRGAGVAMHNISERIKRFYGPRSSVAVDSAPGEGTTITLHLDLQDTATA